MGKRYIWFFLNVYDWQQLVVILFDTRAFDNDSITPLKKKLSWRSKRFLKEKNEDDAKTCELMASSIKRTLFLMSWHNALLLILAKHINRAQDLTFSVIMYWQKTKLYSQLKTFSFRFCQKVFLMLVVWFNSSSNNT